MTGGPRLGALRRPVACRLCARYGRLGAFVATPPAMARAGGGRLSAGVVVCDRGPVEAESCQMFAQSVGIVLAGFVRERDGEEPSSGGREGPRQSRQARMTAASWTRLNSSRAVPGSTDCRRAASPSAACHRAQRTAILASTIDRVMCPRSASTAMRWAEASRSRRLPGQPVPGPRQNADSGPGHRR